jgi:hypothetical protein
MALDYRLKKVMKAVCCVELRATWKRLAEHLRCRLTRFIPNSVADKGRRKMVKEGLIDSRCNLNASRDVAQIPR